MAAIQPTDSADPFRGIRVQKENRIYPERTLFSKNEEWERWQ